MLKRISVYTLGCKVNQYESEEIENELIKLGFTLVPHNEVADIYVINTCSVTSKADYQSKQVIRRLAKINPHAMLIVTGCYAETFPDELRTIEGVTAVIGNHDKQTIATIIKNHVSYPSQSENKSDNMCKKPLNISQERHNKRTRGLLRIQNGCDLYCTYCIVPFARGRLSSLPPHTVIDELIRYHQNGYHEVVLTGINLGKYGIDLPSPTSLGTLLDEIAKLDLDMRVRLSSLEPQYLSKDLLTSIKRFKNTCKHLHIPVQSGDDFVLKMMGRTYTRSFVRDLIWDVAQSIKDICIGVDVIVGFPGEGEVEFWNTYRLLEELPTAYFHVFPFSPRRKTRAYEFPCKVDGKVKRQRAKILRELGAKKRKAFYETLIGKKTQVIFETNMKGRFWKGLSDNYVPVIVESHKLRNNIKASVIIDNVNDSYVNGRLA